MDRGVQGDKDSTVEVVAGAEVVGGSQIYGVIGVEREPEGVEGELEAKAGMVALAAGAAAAASLSTSTKMVGAASLWTVGIARGQLVPEA